MIRKLAVKALAAGMLTVASLIIHPPSDERAMYGFEGPVEQNLLVRKLAGWPAPFLADSPDTSVPHKIGPEDDFRPGPFVASCSFWLLLVQLVDCVRRRMARRRAAIQTSKVER